MNTETYRARIARKLTQAFAPMVLEIQDDFASHAGHAGQHPEGETHFDVLIVSPVFKDMDRVTRHREIYRILKKELQERVHALSLRAFAPDEYARTRYRKATPSDVF